MKQFSRLPLLRYCFQVLLVLSAAWLLHTTAWAQAPGWQGAAAIGNSTNATSANGIFAMAPEAGGNVYVTGTFYDRAVFNGTTITSQADGSGFVAKWSPVTRRFIWVIQFGGGQGVVTPLALAVRGADVFVAGGFTVTGLNWGNAAFVSNSSFGNSDGFVAKLTDLGSSVSYGWLQRAGGSGYDLVEGLAISGNNVYVAGTFSGTAAFGGTSAASLGSRDGFVAKLTDAGASGAFTWVQRIGGTGVEEGHKVAAANGNLYVTASTSGSVTLGNATYTSAGGTDGLVVKLTDAGSSGSVGWVQQLQGTGNEVAQDVAVSGAAVYVAGSFTSAAAAFGPATLSSAGGLDGVVARLTDAGPTGVVAWAQRLGGPFDDEPQALTVVGGKAFVAGYFNSGGSASGPVATFGSTSLQAVGGSDAFLTRLTDTGLTGRFDWAQAAGSAADDYANAVSVNGITPCVGGFFTGASCALGATNLSNLYPGSATSFVASLTDVTLATRDVSLQAGLGLYPNPAHGTTTVLLPASAAPASLTLLDALGRVLRVQAASTGAPVAFDLEGIAPGMYTLRVQTGASWFVRTLIVE
ncbi:T9SS type A sorting domain-containing protein [Hymenobacter elongatus]|uniref:T9SS type A sorting domain-containing protein n=1 Tax=Hymenobacter elongatus TaxID=877208 RepID=A0A4Z0PNG6_9BACT|nr:T9SS type A sorting domain-containing protein [Hymenobacter elongatus]TGE17784.1 T9SS type A sorting domain-containing protein [Hymenobacter elongatus]